MQGLKRHPGRFSCIEALEQSTAYTKRRAVMKSSLRTVLALVVTSLPWLAIVAQSQQQEMNSTKEPQMQSTEQEKHPGDSGNDMKMMNENQCSTKKTGKMDKHKAKKMKNKKERKQDDSSQGSGI
jgi:hypothetical protein